MRILSKILKSPLRYHLWVILLIAGFGFLIYSNTLQSAFQFDDAVTVIHNPAVRNLKNIPLLWQNFNARFLTGLSFALNYSAGKLNPSGYHAVNILIHLLVSLCVYFFIRLLFKTPGLRDSSLKNHFQLIAVFSSLIFLTHPIQTEAVTYITQRSTSLATFFYLTALIFYLKWRFTSRISLKLAALCAMILGMFTREMTVTIPLMLVILEFFFFGSWSKEGLKRFKELIPFLIGLAIVPLIVINDNSLYSVLSIREQLATSHFNPYLFLTEMNVLVTYLRLLFLPINQNIDYDYLVSPGFFSLSTFPSFLILGGLVFFAIRQFKANRLTSFCILWFFVTTSVEFMASASIGHDLIFEHYLYLPMVGFALWIPMILLNRIKSIKKVVFILSLLVIIFSVLTIKRNQIWQTPIRLWEDALRKSPDKARTNNNLGFAYNNAGDYETAIWYYRRALEVDLDDFRAYNTYNNLGIAYSQLGQSDKAIPFFKESIRLNPYFAEGYNNLGVAYANQGNYNQAIQYYHRVIELRRNISQTYTNLAFAYGKIKDFDKEIEYSQQALMLEPDNAVALINLGLAYAEKGEFETAERYLRAVLQANPNSSEAQNNMGIYYIKKKDTKVAIEFFKKALELNPSNAEAQRNLGLAQEEFKRK